MKSKVKTIFLVARQHLIFFSPFFLNYAEYFTFPKSGWSAVAGATTPDKKELPICCRKKKEAWLPDGTMMKLWITNGKICSRKKKTKKNWSKENHFRCKRLAIRIFFGGDFFLRLFAEMSFSFLCFTFLLDGKWKCIQVENMMVILKTEADYI